MKKIFLFFAIILLIGFVSGVEIRINPANLEFNGETGEKICLKINIFSDYNGYILGKTKWSRQDSRELKDYQIEIDDTNLILEYNEKIKIKESSEQEICLTSSKPGNYYGALLYNTENSPAGIGIWIYAEIAGADKTANKITGKTIDSKDDSITKAVYLLPSVFLSIVLVALLLYSGSKKKHS